MLNKVMSDDLHIKTGVCLTHESKKGLKVDLLLWCRSVFSEGHKQETSLPHLAGLLLMHYLENSLWPF